MTVNIVPIAPVIPAIFPTFGYVNAIATGANKIKQLRRTVINTLSNAYFPVTIKRICALSIANIIAVAPINYKNTQNLTKTAKRLVDGSILRQF